jgi:hypothetical protein
MITALLSESEVQLTDDVIESILDQVLVIVLLCFGFVFASGL